jgi:hypothetical protein
LKKEIKRGSDRNYDQSIRPSFIRLTLNEDQIVGELSAA